MTITEQFICGKHTAADCEDGIVITNDFAAVIDGSTSKTPKRLGPSMKNGRFAMLLISEYIKQMPADYTMNDFCRGITLRIAEEYNKRGIAEDMAKHPEERLTASAIIYSNSRKEVWMVGDCQTIIDGEHYDNSKPYEQEIAMQRATLIRNGISPKEARCAIEPQLIKAMLEGQTDSMPLLTEHLYICPALALSQHHTALCLLPMVIPPCCLHYTRVKKPWHNI